MKILFIGDIVGKSGRDIVSSLLYGIKEEYRIDLTIASGIKNENTVYTIAEGDALFCAVVIDVDEEKKKPVGIRRIQIRPE